MWESVFLVGESGRGNVGESEAERVQVRKRKWCTGVERRSEREKWGGLGGGGGGAGNKMRVRDRLMVGWKWEWIREWVNEARKRTEVD